MWAAARPGRQISGEVAFRLRSRCVFYFTAAGRAACTGESHP
jgi:hypothetical protein